MTGKRFVKTHKTINWWAVLDNGKELLEDEVVELLNEQHETIQRLKQNIDELLSVNVEEELLKENEQLQKQLDREHQMLENAILLERTRMGKNCLKQFKDAIQ